MLIDLVLERLKLDKYKNSSNIFKRWYFKYKIEDLKSEFSSTFLENLRKVDNKDNKYSLYSVVIEYVEMMDKLLKIYPDKKFYPDDIIVSIFNTKINKFISIVEKDYNFILKINTDDPNRIINSEFTRTENGQIFVTHFEISEDEKIYYDTEIKKTKYLVDLKTRNTIVLSIYKIIYEM